MKFIFICILRIYFSEGRHDETLENFRCLMFTETNSGVQRKLLPSKWNLTITKQNSQNNIKLPLFLDLLSSLITYARSKLLEFLIPFPCKKDKNPFLLCS